MPSRQNSGENTQTSINGRSNSGASAVEFFSYVSNNGNKGDKR